MKNTPNFEIFQLVSIVSKNPKLQLPKTIRNLISWYMVASNVEDKLNLWKNVMSINEPAALRATKLKEIERLIREGVEVNMINNPYFAGPERQVLALLNPNLEKYILNPTLLHLAVDSNDVELAKILLDGGANMFMRGIFSGNAFDLAKWGSPEMRELFLTHKSNTVYRVEVPTATTLFLYQAANAVGADLRVPEPRIVRKADSESKCSIA